MRRRLLALALTPAAATAAVPAAHANHYPTTCTGIADTMCRYTRCIAVDCFVYDCEVYLNPLQQRNAALCV